MAGNLFKQLASRIFSEQAAKALASNASFQRFAWVSVEFSKKLFGAAAKDGHHGVREVMREAAADTRQAVNSAQQARAESQKVAKASRSKGFFDHLVDVVSEDLGMKAATPAGKRVVRKRAAAAQGGAKVADK